MAILNILYTNALPIAAGVIFLVTAAVLWIRQNRPLNKIDGPKGNLLFGIGLSLPPKATQRLREWAQQHGEVYKIRIGWYHWVILNSPEAVKEIMDKQVSDHRPLFTIFTIYQPHGVVDLVFVKNASTDGGAGRGKHEDVDHALWTEMACISRTCA